MFPIDTLDYSTDGVSVVVAEHLDSIQRLYEIAVCIKVLVIDSSDNGALPADKTAAATARARNDYLGTFVYKANEIVSLTYTVVCWFEGTDPEIVNRANKNDYQSVTATLEFDAINLG